MTPKSNKPRGTVRIDRTRSPGTRTTANPMREDPNQKQGPRSGNAGNTAKQRDFMAEKSARSSYFSALADMVRGALERRGGAMRPNQPPEDDPKALTSLKGDWGRARRGPTKGNR